MNEVLAKLLDLIPDWIAEYLPNWSKGALIWLVGDLNYQIAYLILVIAIDTLFAMWAAKRNGEFDMKTLFSKLEGKLVVYLFWIIISHAADKILTLNNSSRWMTIVILLGAEIVSSARNTAKLGYTKIADALESTYMSLISPKGGTTKNEDPRNTDGK